MTTLNALQQDELNNRSSDVDTLVSRLASNGRYTTREDAFLAWSEYSDRSAASWLIISNDDEVLQAYDSLVLDRVEKAARNAADRAYHSEIADFVRDYLAQAPVDEEEIDALIVTGEDETVLGRMRLYSSNEQGLLDAVIDRFNVEIDNEGRRWRGQILSVMGIRIHDAQGYPA